MMSSVGTAIAIRDARPADFAAIRALAEDANEEFRAVMGGLYAPYLANVLDVEARAAAATVLVATEGSEIVGTITLYRDIRDEGMPVRLPDGTAGVRAMAVSPAARGHGIGGELVRALLDRAREWGVTSIALHTADFMGSAMRVYERHGFRRAPEHDYRAEDYFVGETDASFVAVAFVLDLDAG